MPRDALDVGLAAELALVTDFLRDARDLRGERVELIDHLVDGGADAQELAADRASFDLEDHLLREVAARDGGDDARDLVGRRDEVGDELVDRRHAARPGALGGPDRRALVHLAFLADDLADADELAGHVLVQADDVVEQLARAAEDAVLVVGEANAEIALLHGLQHLEQLLDLRAARRQKRSAPGDGCAGAGPRAILRRRKRLAVSASAAGRRGVVAVHRGARSAVRHGFLSRPGPC